MMLQVSTKHNELVPAKPEQRILNEDGEEETPQNLDDAQYMEVGTPTSNSTRVNKI